MREIFESTARMTSKGQVTIPVEMRRELGLNDGDTLLFRCGEGVITMIPAKKPTLTELLAGFDPTKHRHGPEDRPWDDAPRGLESI
jgi:antitoxin PrlF